MKNKRSLSLGLAAVLAVSVCGCGESTQTVKEAAGKTLEDTKEGLHKPQGLQRKRQAGPPTKRQKRKRPST